MAETIVYYTSSPVKGEKNRRNLRELEAVCMRAVTESRNDDGLYPYSSKSHSQGNAVIAVSRYPVGCDMEAMPCGRDVFNILKGLFFFTDKDEADSIMESEDPARAAITAWTERECAYKACGSRSRKDARDLSGMKFESIYTREGFVITCCVRQGSRISWVRVPLQQGAGIKL